MTLKISMDQLRRTLALVNGDTLQIGLFSNNVTPGVASVIGDFTPATFGGYGGLVSLTGQIISDDGTIATSEWSSVTWTCDGTASGDVWGYYVYNLTQTKLAWAEKNPAGMSTLAINGQTYTVLPRRTNQNV